MSVQPVEQIVYPNDSTSKLKTKTRLVTEHKWLQYLQTPYPLGLNDSIYQMGNISKDPSIDIFSIFSIRKRKTRSHGVRKNGNIKRKLRLRTNIADLQKLLSDCGRHALLSRLTSLSISSLKDLHEQADKIFLRTDPLCKTAAIVQSYTEHVLRPHIDKESDHKRYFIKIPFINKGVDFIDLQSIFRNKIVTDTIPKYFKNSEPPIICYKYNKPIRNIIMNYNQIVSDLNITENTPLSCDVNIQNSVIHPQVTLSQVILISSRTNAFGIC